MANSRNSLPALAFVAIVVAIVYFAGHQKTRNDQTSPSSSSRASDSSPDDNEREFDGYTCTGDCSGHEAGYRWAQERGISDADDCDAAGEHSNSPSFAEGCHAYVDGDAEPKNNDEDDESDDVE
jgi:hypothetical protein